MPHVVSTTHVTHARYTVAGTLHAIATEDSLRGGIWHEAALADDAQLSEAWIESVTQGNTLTLRVLDRPDLAQPLLAEDDTPLLTEAGDPILIEYGAFGAVAGGSVDGLQVTVETVTTCTYADGSTAEFVAMQTLTCTGRERQAGSVALSLVDIEDVRLNSLWPVDTFTTALFPALSDLDVGRAVPFVYGVADKMPCTRVTNVAPYRYFVSRGFPIAVLTVYRGSNPADARVVSPSEYSVIVDVFPGTPSLSCYIEFAAEQRDFSGAEYRIYADVQESGLATDRPTRIIQTLMLAAGATVNLASVTAGDAFVVANGLLTDCDFGRDGQRTIRAIVEDLLWVARATLTRNATGEYVILCDDASASVATYDEDAGDDIEVLGVTEQSQPNSVGIRYRPSPRDPAALQFDIARGVPGGTQGIERPRELRYVRRHDTADRCAYYRSQRARFSARLRARIYRVVHTIGQVITVSSRAFDLAGDQWRIRNVRRIPGGCEIEATPYNAALVGYVAGTLPGDAGIDYTPDYSATPPAVPTSLRITAGSTALASDGTLTARVVVDAIPPSVNWQALWFAAVHNVTGEIPSLLPGEDVGAGRYGTTLTGLRPGEVYKLLAYAVNPFGVQGVVQATFDATAIGGGAFATVFTAPGYATVPANVSSISAVQGTGRLFNISWPAVSTANLREYVLERRIGAGAYSEIWRGQATSYIDRDVAYGSTYQYRIKARDTWGNVSAGYATSAAVSLTTGTVVGGGSSNDIGSSTVAPTNRTSITTVSQAYSLTGAVSASVVVAHALGKVPIAVVRTNNTQHVVSVTTTTGAAINVRVIGLLGDTEFGGGTATGVNSVAAFPHTHVAPSHNHGLRIGGAIDGPGTVSADIW